MHMDAEYRPYDTRDSADMLSDHDLQLREGHYLDCVATVGQFEHQLSTDLLNHLVLVQKVFVKVWAVSCALLLIMCLMHVHSCSLTAAKPLVVMSQLIGWCWDRGATFYIDNLRVQVTNNVSGSKRGSTKSWRW